MNEEQLENVNSKKNVKIRNTSAPSWSKLFKQRARLFWDTERFGTYVKPKNG